MRKFISVLCASFIALAGAATASAQTASNTANVEVTDAGELVVLIGSADFTAVPYDFDDQSTTADIVVHVEDHTGSGNGWNVTIFGDATFTSETTTSTIPISGLVMTTGAPVVVEGQPVTGITAPGVTMGFDSTGQTIATALPESGQGIYDITYPSTLNVPGGTQVGDYDATLTVSITSGP